MPTLLIALVFTVVHTPSNLTFRTVDYVLGPGISDLERKTLCRFVCSGTMIIRNYFDLQWI